jgi:hypothetical protein
VLVDPSSAGAGVVDDDPSFVGAEVLDETFGAGLAVAGLYLLSTLSLFLLHHSSAWCPSNLLLLHKKIRMQSTYDYYIIINNRVISLKMTETHAKTNASNT